MQPEDIERQRLINSELAKDIKALQFKEQLLTGTCDFEDIIRVCKLLHVEDAKKDIKLVLPEIRDIEVECEQDSDKHGTYTYIDRYVLHFTDNECLFLARDADTFLNEVADDHIHLVNKLGTQEYIDPACAECDFTLETKQRVEAFYRSLDKLTELYSLDPSGHVYSF